MHDITRRKRAEEALRKSEAQYRLIINNAQEGLFVAQDGILRFLNARVEEIWGYSQAELLSLSFLDFIHPEDRDLATNAHFTRLRGKGGLNQSAFRMITKDGALKWVEVSDVLIDWEGKPATLNFVTDITARKQAEDQLAALVREQDVFLREVHHRIRNTIQTIYDLLTLQATYIRDEQILQLCEETQNRIKSIELVQEKLYQSKDVSTIAFREYIHELANTALMNYHVSPERVLLKFDLEDVIVSVHTAVPCGLMLHELLSNALKHAFPADKEGEIRIILRSTAAGIELRVSDNGVGMPEAFDFRKTNTLGFQLVTSIIAQQLQGTIELRQNDPGTEVVIRFKEPQ